MELDFVYEGAALGLLLIAVGELFGVGTVSVLGVGVFVVTVLAGFPVMTADLVAGTLRESSATAFDVDFDASNAGHRRSAVSAE
jgi:hypothetical protein